MRKEDSLEHISDGKIYDIKSMVKVETDGCKGCSACCHDVGDLVELNPYDISELIKGSGISYDEMVDEKIEFRRSDKIELPFLKMKAISKACSFLDCEERCSVHDHRPSICRLFPLGRVYEKDDFKYFLQVGACVKPNLRKAKVKKWINIENYRDNKEFILEWHNFIKALSFRLKFVRDQEEIKGINEDIKEMFYRQQPADGESFYIWFAKQLVTVKDRVGLI